MDDMLRLTVYNTKTDTTIFRMVGHMPIIDQIGNDLKCAVKTGENELRTNSIHLNRDTMYIVEDVRGEFEDPYHYEVWYYPANTTIVERIMG